MENITTNMRKVQLVPSNNLWKELGNNTYSFDEALSELIDNSISACVNNRCDIDIEFYLNICGDKSYQVCDRIIVRDNSSGIKEDDISNCFTPAGKISKKSLNEHGLGFKQSISTLGNLVYFKSKNEEESGFTIKEFNFDLEIFDDKFDFVNGTEICINPDSQRIQSFNVSSINYEKQIKILDYQFGARYRYIMQKKNIKLKLKVINLVTNENYEKLVEPIFPIYYHPWQNGGSAKAIIHNKKFISSNGSEALLTFGFHPKDDQEYERIGIDKDIYVAKQTRGRNNKHVNHPYSWRPSSQGLDIIMNDRVIKFHQSPEIGLFGTRENWYNGVRGEIKLMSGFKTTSTKNEIVRTEDYVEILEQIRFYLSNGTDRDITDDDRINWKNEFNLNLLSYAKNMLKDGTAPIDDSEDELKNRLEKILNLPTTQHSEVKREYIIEALGVSTDFLVDGIPWEVKNHEATTHDISQLLTYMVSMNKNNGVFIASGYTQGCEYLIKIISESIFDSDGNSYNIKLMKISDFNINF